jgi:hypothetical protein
MLEISDYNSLDERLAAGPAFDALCQNCRSITLLELFSGPRYDDSENSFDHPTLDVCIGSVSEFYPSAERCRLCYTISAFHDAKHNVMGIRHPNCEGDVELAVLKPYRTDAVMFIKDASNDSDKESIATAISLVFEGPDDFQRRQHGGFRLPPVRLNDSSPDGIVSLTKKVDPAEAQKSDLSDGNKPTKPVSRDNVSNPPQPDFGSCSSFSFAGARSQDSCVSRMGVVDMDFRPEKLSGKDAYWYHHFLFCLTNSSPLVGRRSTLLFSSTAEGPKIDWPSLRGWLQDCENNHAACRLMQVDPIVEEGLHLRCIDVKSSTIVAVDTHARYLTLSYVWGTTHSELSGQIGHCIIGTNSTLMTESLPSAIRDAIRITELLGEQYLWVDSLCLDQNDPSALKVGIGFMDRIYANSVLTLVPSTGQDVHSETPGIRPFSRLKSVSEVCIDKQVIKAICAVSAALEFSGPWRLRGWTYQEWMLSRRCLYFSGGQILFRCQQSSGLESFQPPTGSSPSAITIPHRFQADKQSAATLHSFFGAALYDQTWSFQLYTGLVREYSGRCLTYESDVFHAFTAILRTIERSSGMTFVEAMPAKDLLRALVWTSTTAAKEYRRHEISSWAWAGWSFRGLYLCWESARSPGEEMHSAQRSAKSLGSMTSQVKRAVTASSWSVKKPRFPAVFVHDGHYEAGCLDYHSYRSYRLRCATVSIHPALKNTTKTCLLLISETRSVLIHRNAPTNVPDITIGNSRDDLLHPVTRQVIAGHNYVQSDFESWHLLNFNLSVAVSPDQSYTSHTAVLMYEWKIRGEVRRWHRRVVAMIVDRLADGTVERLTVVAVHGAVWRTLPLLSEREELLLV